MLKALKFMILLFPLFTLAGDPFDPRQVDMAFENDGTQIRVTITTTNLVIRSVSARDIGHFSEMVCSQPIIGECSLTPTTAQILLNRWIQDWEQGKFFNAYSVYDQEGHYIAHVSFRYGKVTEIYMRVIPKNGKQAFLDEITNAFVHHLSRSFKEKGHLFFGIMIRTHNVHDRAYQPVLRDQYKMMEKPASIPPQASQAAADSLRQTKDYMHLDKEERAFIGDIKMGFMVITDQQPNIEPQALIMQLKAAINILRAHRRAYDHHLLQDQFIASVLLSVDTRDERKHQNTYQNIIDFALNRSPVDSELLTISPEDPEPGVGDYI